ncbi:MAG: imidazole glycerol phosphate synthase subunit HisH [Steroidobacteraceae bacterium]
MAEVAVIDSGGANLASLLHALQRLGARAEVTTDFARIEAATHVLLPGVGAAFDAMERLEQAGLARRIATLRQPLLGICLGMQLLFESSEEAPPGEPATRCLGVLPGHVSRMQADADHPVPHMGWNTLELLRPDPLFAGFGAADYVYFVHSYAASAGEATLAVTDYGRRVPAAVRRGNFRGVQFHPERSAKAGARLLANFLAIEN